MEWRYWRKLTMSMENATQKIISKEEIHLDSKVYLKVCL